MRNKSFIAAISLSLILILTVGGVLIIEVARANPIPWPSTPNQDKPTLTVQTPQNNTSYNADNSVYLSFTVTEPGSWHNPQWGVVPFGLVDSVKAYLDGNVVNLTYNFSGVPFEMERHYSSSLNLSASGLHMLNVTVLSYTYYRGPAYNGSHILSGITSSSGPVYEYPTVVSDIIYFTVEQPTQNTSPLPSNPAFSSIEFLLITVIVVFAVTSLAVFSFKRVKTS